MTKKPLIILTGPTAVGKTALSIELAKKINGEIISADSMQVYRHMDIGTAKITKEEMDGVKHHLIDILDPDQEFNVFAFKDAAKKAMEEIYAAGHIPIIAGGTGFYIQAVLYDIDFTETNQDFDYRNELMELAEKKGNSYVHDLLKKVDEKAAEAIHENNLKRVIRALEYHKLTGKKISEHNDEQRQKTSPYNFVYFVLNDDRAKLYERIDKRVGKMVSDGLLSEVKSLMDMGYDRSYVSMQGIGYKEIIDYYNGILSLPDAIDLIKKDTRHFAKRQLTWFGREKEVSFVNINEFGPSDTKAKILEYMIDLLLSKHII